MDAASDGEAPGSCPKCGKKRSAAAEACARCGLVFSLWKDEQRIPGSQLDSQGEELWAKVRDNWSDALGHEAFLRHCLLANTLAAAGRLYRQRLDEDPKDVLAAQMQNQVLAKATLALAVSKTQPRPAVTRSRLFWAVVLTAMALGILGGLLWGRLH